MRLSYRKGLTILSRTILCSITIGLNHVVLGNSVNLRSTRAYSLRVEECSQFDQSIADRALKVWQVRLKACVNAVGGHFEHMLQLL
jgi:hypothetical protein